MLLVLASLVPTVANHDELIERAWNDWEARHDSLSATDTETRHHAFLQNHEIIRRHNLEAQRGVHSFFLTAAGPFADMARLPPPSTWAFMIRFPNALVAPPTLPLRCACTRVLHVAC